MSEFLLVSSTFAREPWLAILLVFGILVGFGALFLRLNCIAFGEPRGPHGRGEGILSADVFTPRDRVRRRHLHPAGDRNVVPECGKASGLVSWGRRRIRLHKGDGSTRIVHGRARSSRPTIGEPFAMSLPAGRATLLGLWGDAGAVHMAILMDPHGYGGRRHLSVPMGHFLRSGARHAPAIRLERAIHDLYGLQPVGARRYAAMARPRLLGRAASAWCPRPGGGPSALCNSCRPKAKACIRFQSVRCMPASSSPDISVSPPTARPSSGSNSASAMCTRASSR